MDGYLLSGAGRNALPPKEKEALTYGELPLATFHELMQRCQPKAGEAFIDLGAGLGQLVLAAAYYYPFKKSAGVERLPPLLEAAKAAHAKLASACAFKTERVEFHLSDISEVAWQDYDVLLAHATCYSDDTIAHLTAGLTKIRKGGRMLVLGQALPQMDTHLQERFSYRTQWHRHGSAYLYLRP